MGNTFIFISALSKIIIIKYIYFHVSVLNIVLAGMLEMGEGAVATQGGDKDCQKHTDDYFYT